MSPTTATSRRTRASSSFAGVLTGILEVPQLVAGEDAISTALKAQLDQLPKEWQEKIGALMNLGRTVHEQSHADGSISDGGSAPLAALALCDERTRRNQYLERGLAMLCSDGRDLDGPPADREEGSASVYERAWTRFGRELAASEPDEWSWFAQRAGGRAEVLRKVYLRRGDGCWWSFGANLDRPQKSEVGPQQAKAGKRSRKDQGSGLASLVALQCAERRALQRAMRSVQARMGIIARQGASGGAAA